MNKRLAENPNHRNTHKKPIDASAIVFNIQRMSIHDGPGIRTTVFLKGCPLRCQWCHNPESWIEKPEILWSQEACLGCGRCLSVCQRQCYTLVDGKRAWDRQRCGGCGTCARECPPRALELVGQHMTVDEVMAEVVKDRAFYEESGGGMTVSGGEPLMHADFVESLLTLSKKMGIGTNIQTNLHSAWENVERLLPLLDSVQADLKAASCELHRQLTGVPNERILENLRRLASTKIPLTIRTPIIPGLNDAEEEVTAMAEFVASLQPVPPVELLPYHRLGEGKFRRMGQEYELAEVRTPETTHMDVLKAIFRERNVIVLP